ncbi:MAG: hypothetical protein ACRDQI_15790 [Pseudonocardiaceae bacterium]
MMLVSVVIEELSDSRDGVLTLDEAVRGGLTLRQVDTGSAPGSGPSCIQVSTWSADVSLTSGPARGQRWPGQVRELWRAG